MALVQTTEVGWDGIKAVEFTEITVGSEVYVSVLVEAHKVRTIQAVVDDLKIIEAGKAYWMKNPEVSECLLPTRSTNITASLPTLGTT